MGSTPSKVIIEGRHTGDFVDGVTNEGATTFQVNMRHYQATSVTATVNFWWWAFAE